MVITLNSGEKGGPGKSTFARLFASYLNSTSVKWRVIDTDQSYAAMAKTGLKEVEEIKLYQDAHLNNARATQLSDAIGRAFEDGIEVLVIDMGGGQLEAIIALIAETGIGELVDIERLIVTYTITSDFQSLATLKDATDAYAGISGDANAGMPELEWVIVSNERDGELRRYKDSELRSDLLKRGAKEVTMPRLHDPDVMQTYAESGRLLYDYLAPESGLGWGPRARLSKWAGVVFAGLDAADILPPPREQGVGAAGQER